MSELRYQYGRLSYRKKSSGVELGREDWWLTRNRDGTVTMRCLAMTDDSRIVRDVVYTRVKGGRPTDVFIRLQAGDQLTGTGYFRIDGDVMNVVTDCAGTGHAVQTIKVPMDFFSITTHAVMLDGWIFFNYDRAIGGEQVRTVYNTSLQWNGSQSLLGRLGAYRVNFIGEEEVEIPAGNFKATHFQVESDLLDAPTSQIWVAGEDKILLRCDWGELDLEHVLTSWRVEL